MVKDLDGRPTCGTGSCMLGARVPVDIKPDESGQVHPGGGGLSVTPHDPVRLPPHLRPISLGGFGKLPVFEVEEGDLGTQLRYRPDARKPDRHGQVEPALAMVLAQYQGALAATRAAWRQIA